MKYIPTVLALALVPACCVATRTPDTGVSQTDMIENLKQQTIAMVDYIDDKGHEVDAKDVQLTSNNYHLSVYCAGVWVSHDTILTAEHCVDDIGRPKFDIGKALDNLLKDMQNNGASITVTPASWTPVGQRAMYAVPADYDNNLWRWAKVTAVDMKNDLALLVTEKPVAAGHPVAHLALDPFNTGDTLHIVGHPGSIPWSYMRGYISGHRPTGLYPDKGGPLDVIQVEAPLWGGNSGGGAFNDRGQLVGIAQAIARPVPDIGILVCRDTLHSFLQSEGIIPAHS
jgi:trypsin-like peptidase